MNKFYRWLYLIVVCFVFIIVGYAFVLSVIEKDVTKVTLHGFGMMFIVYFIFDAIEVLKANYRYMVTYLYEDKNGKTGNGRIFINVSYPIKTPSDVLKVDEHIKQEYEFRSVGITNYIKLSHDKKDRKKE